jgi:sterol carrier protein 2
MSKSLRPVFVVGVGMTKFEKPGSRDWDYPDMVKEAGEAALSDARINYKDVQQVVAGWVYGDSTAGQRAVYVESLLPIVAFAHSYLRYTLGLSGVPIYNVNNNCSTGSSALFLAHQLVAGGVADCVLAVGFEKMEKGSLGAKFSDRVNPLDKHLEAMFSKHEISASPMAAQMFGNAGREHMEKYGTSAEVFARIAEKNHRHSANNPYAQFRDKYTLEQIMASPKVYHPMTKLQCCPTSDGAGVAVVVSESFVIAHGLQDKAVEIIGIGMATDTKAAFEGSMIQMVGAGMTERAATAAYAMAGVKAQDVQVIELHDCFSANELITYEGLGLCPQGQAGQLVMKGDVTYGGKWVVNPSGGLISKGHPLGATGLAQCAEICWQLRGEASARQVANATIGLQHNLGLGGACIVALYKKYKPTGATMTKRPTAATVSAESVFAMLGEELPKHPDVVSKVQGVYQWNITGDNAQKWVVDLKNGAGSVRKGEVDKSDCIITVSESDFVGMMTGTANSQQLFMQGKLKVKGAMSYAMKLGELQKLRPKGGSGAGKTSAMEPIPTAGTATAADVFAMLGEELPKHPDVVSKVQGVYQWNITGDNAQKWVVDLKNGAGSVRKGEVDKSDCSITVSESDFVGMMTGTANSQQLFMQGKLKVKGAMSYAMKLGELQKLRPKA